MDCPSLLSELSTRSYATTFLIALLRRCASRNVPHVNAGGFARLVPHGPHLETKVEIRKFLEKLGLLRVEALPKRGSVKRLRISLTPLGVAAARELAALEDRLEQARATAGMEDDAHSG